MADRSEAGGLNQSPLDGSPCMASCCAYGLFPQIFLFPQTPTGLAVFVRSRYAYSVKGNPTQSKDRLYIDRPAEYLSLSHEN
jgi:hypothetical protein